MVGKTRQELGQEQIGSFQQKVINIMKKKRKWTIHEIAKVLYGKPVDSNSTEFIKIYRALSALVCRGVVKQTRPEIEWSLKS